MIRRAEDEKLADGLWKIFFYNHSKFKCWLVFIDDPTNKTIAQLNRYPRYKKGKNMTHVFKAMGLTHISDVERKKALKKLLNQKDAS